MTEYNIYCDESCHLAHDRQPIMVIGGIWYDFRQVRMAIVEGKKCEDHETNRINLS